VDLVRRVTAPAVESVVEEHSRLKLFEVVHVIRDSPGEAASKEIVLIADMRRPSVVWTRYFGVSLHGVIAIPTQFG
jgi:hypothetical protein